MGSLLQWHGERGTRSNRGWSFLSRLAVWMVACGTFALGFQSAPGPPAKAKKPEASQIFASTCGSCHGLDGRGSERAPNIADAPRVQRLTDVEIARIVQEGVPGTGMPAFHSLGSSQVQAVVTYLRALQGARKTVKLPGDPVRGKEVFFGKAGCSGCHMVAGQGGFIASDLSAYGSTHSVGEARSAITHPVPEGDQKTRTATAITHEGSKYVGRIRNEDNFSLQLQTLDGTFHFLVKSDLERLEYDSLSLMPSNYAASLTTNELNDVISFLVNSSNPGDAGMAKRISNEKE